MTAIASSNALIEEVKNLLWGPDLKEEVFNRWSQGFVFSDDEPTALNQYEGGPCAVIAPVQAYIVEQALFSNTFKKDDLKTYTAEDVRSLLINALMRILNLVTSSNTSTYRVVHLEDGIYSGTSTSSGCTTGTNNKSKPSNTESSSGESSCEKDTSSSEPLTPADRTCGSNVDDGLMKNNGGSSPKRPRIDWESFHSCLRCTEYSRGEDTKAWLKSQQLNLQSQYGVLLYLYSVIITKGLEQVKNEIEDLGVPLIDGTYGHGSQSLINLLLTGCAVSNVWDNDRDVSGLKMRGISKQSTVGFLSLLEHLQYCEVGWFLKNPVSPIWVLGSETHLTVLFSKEQRLVIQETQQQIARRVFQNFDVEGNGFIVSSQLGELMQALDLVSEKEYVEIMCRKLDAESLGIVTLHSFLEEFFPGQEVQDTPRVFTLYHYNGLSRSCPENKVVYWEAEVKLEDEPEQQIITDCSTIKTCLQTKWPTIELKWKNSLIPSLN